MHGMEPNLLMQAWMMAHLYGAKYQASVCCGGSSGEAAFRESLRPRYISSRHHSKGLRTYFITGSCDNAVFSRITTASITNPIIGGGCIGDDADDRINHGLLRITVTSNTRYWQEGDLNDNTHLMNLELDVEPFIEIPVKFLAGCSKLQSLSLSSLELIEDVPEGFLSGCDSLKEVDLSPLANVKRVGSSFLSDCSNIASINLEPFTSIEAVTEGFLGGCGSLKELDLSPLLHVKEVGGFFLYGCTNLASVNLAPLKAIETIPEFFLFSCGSLKELDPSPLLHVKKVGGFFLMGCGGLTRVVVPPLFPLDNVPQEIRDLVVIQRL